VRRSKSERDSPYSGLTDGNLSRHLQVLVGSKLVDMTKSFEGNRPQTFCKLTALGRKRYAEYVLVLEQVVRDAAAAKASAARPGSTPAWGFGGFDQIAQWACQALSSFS